MFSASIHYGEKIIDVLKFKKNLNLLNESLVVNTPGSAKKNRDLND